jgi:hypothetical protein
LGFISISPRRITLVHKSDTISGVKGGFFRTRTKSKLNSDKVW